MNPERASDAKKSTPPQPHDGAVQSAELLDLLRVAKDLGPLVARFRHLAESAGADPEALRALMRGLGKTKKSSGS